MKRELVKDWMSRDVITITPKTRLSETHRLMNDYRIRRLPVLKNGKLAGIVTLGDVREAEPSDATSLSIWEINYLLSELTVEKIMTRNPVTITPYATVGEAAWLMLEYRISGLPVIDTQDRIVGILTESDIFRMVVKEWGKVESSPELDIIT